MKLNKIGLPTHIEEKVVEIIKQQLPSIQVDSIGDKLMFEYSKIIVGRLTSEELTSLRACLRAAEYDEEDVKMFMKQKGRPPKQGPLEKMAEKIGEELEQMQPSSSDILKIVKAEPIAIDKEAFDPHITISSEQIKEVGITTDEHMDIFQCMDDIKKINEGIKNLQSTIQELENEKKRLKDRVAELLDEV